MTTALYLWQGFHNKQLGQGFQQMLHDWYTPWSTQ